MSAETHTLSRRRTPGEWLAATALLLALPAIVLAIYLSRTPPIVPPAPPHHPADLAALLPRPAAGSAFRVTTAAKQWPAAKMHEKIDGEDAAYLKHGCVALAAMTLTEAKTDLTVEMYLYRMATPAAARAVFREQAPREDAPDPVDRPTWVRIGDEAYTSYGCCYVRAGALYLKIIAGAATPSAGAETAALALAFVAGLNPGR